MTFQALLEVVPGPGGWWYVETPELIGTPGPFGMRQVTVTIEETSYVTKLWPMKERPGKGFLPMKKSLRTQLGWKLGELRQVEVRA